MNGVVITAGGNYYFNHQAGAERVAIERTNPDTGGKTAAKKPPQPLKGVESDRAASKFSGDVIAMMMGMQEDAAPHEALAAGSTTALSSSAEVGAHQSSGADPAAGGEPMPKTSVIGISEEDGTYSLGDLLGSLISN